MQNYLLTLNHIILLRPVVFMNIHEHMKATETVFRGAVVPLMVQPHTHAHLFASWPEFRSDDWSLDK